MRRLTRLGKLVAGLTWVFETRFWMGFLHEYCGNRPLDVLDIIILLGPVVVRQRSFS